MASIGTDGMIIRGEQREDHSWLFTVCYTACFSDDDLGRRFDDTVAIRELHGCTRIAQSQHGVTFTATSSRVWRKKRIVVPASPVEAVCAEIHLLPAQPR